MVKCHMPLIIFYLKMTNSASGIYFLKFPNLTCSIGNVSKVGKVNSLFFDPESADSCQIIRMARK